MESQTNLKATYTHTNLQVTDCICVYERVTNLLSIQLQDTEAQKHDPLSKYLLLYSWGSFPN